MYIAFPGAGSDPGQLSGQRSCDLRSEVRRVSARRSEAHPGDDVSSVRSGPDSHARSGSSGAGVGGSFGAPCDRRGGPPVDLSALSAPYDPPFASVRVSAAGTAPSAATNTRHRIARARASRAVPHRRMRERSGVAEVRQTPRSMRVRIPVDGTELASRESKTVPGIAARPARVLSLGEGCAPKPAWPVETA